jgi:hypothetical protein
MANPESPPISASDAHRNPAHDPSLKRGFLALQQSWHGVHLYSC